ncbi:uncharacterized protein LOC34622944 [Cyclospora cayetanensis]|uniref:Uncharacterized protein LOC34622944 n=1 Tax=Cyclospora cayetanensis TaxID=88456 RepID=A0A6P6RYN5_9EIME|nr:uncharacterized protein LOC34622944 [Cyclospora cayetanensis]
MEGTRGSRKYLKPGTLRSLEKDVKERSRRRALMGEDLDRQLKELQEKEAVEGKALQLQLQHEQQKLQQLLLQQKQISKQMDIEIADSGLAIKGKNTTVAPSARQQESMQQETLNQIDAFLVDKPPNQTLGAGWRGQGLVPPTAVTKLGV